MSDVFSVKHFINRPTNCTFEDHEFDPYIIAVLTINISSLLSLVSVMVATLVSAWRTSKLLSSKKPPEVIIQEDPDDIWGDFNDPNNLSSMEQDLDDLYDRLPSPSHETLADPHSPM